MAYKISLFGYEGSGKTSLFQQLTGSFEKHSNPFMPVSAEGLYKDKVLQGLGRLAGAEKLVYPHFEFYDVKGMPSAAGFDCSYFKHFFGTDLICCVVNNFSAPEKAEQEGMSLLMELLFHDTERLQGIMRGAEEDSSIKRPQHPAILKAIELLNKEELLNTLAPEDKKMISSVELLTVKELLLLFNGRACSPIQFPRPFVQQDLHAFDPEPFFTKLKTELGLITFYTIKGTIARGWLAPASHTARQAAGNIHKDIEKGFVRAAAVAAEVLLGEGSWQQAKSAGKLRMLGPEANISDGDVVEFLFSK